MTPVNFKGLYAFSYAGLIFGKMGIEVEQTADGYAMTSDIASTGIINWFVRHTSHTTSQGSGHDFTYPDRDYETHYQTKKKPKYARMSYREGVIRELETLPPEPNRPKVPDALKNSASDPLSFLLNLRQALYEARKSGKTGFTFTVFDGRRLTQADFIIAGTKSLSYAGRQVTVIDVNARRQLLAGFNDSELADHDPKEPVLHIYFTDDARLLPIRLEAKSFMTLSATLVKECTTGESCLLGLKE